MKTGNVLRALPRLRFWFLLLPLLLGLRGRRSRRPTSPSTTKRWRRDGRTGAGRRSTRASTAQCQYGSRLDRGHARRLVGALPAVRRRAGRHAWLSESSPSRCTAEPPAARLSRSWPLSTTCPSPLCASQRLAAGTWQKITVPLAALGADNRADVNGFWFQESAGVDSTHLLRRHHRAGVRRSADTAAAGQRHEHLQDALDNGWNNWSWASVNTAARPRYTPDPAQSP